jgi:ABC-type phosphate transport system substrate-binding protein
MKLARPTWVSGVTALIALATLALLPARGVSGKNDIALIVHKSNPRSNLTSAELRRIFLGDLTRWPSNDRITILLLPPGTGERQEFLRTVLRMSDDDFVRHWISRVFQGEASAGPKTASSAASMARLVGGLPTAVGVIGAADVPAGDSTLKVLKIDGKAPGETGYRLRR